MSALLPTLALAVSVFALLRQSLRLALRGLSRISTQYLSRAILHRQLAP